MQVSFYVDTTLQSFQNYFQYLVFHVSGHFKENFQKMSEAAGCILCFSQQVCARETSADILSIYFLRPFLSVFFFPVRYGDPASVCSHLPWHYLYHNGSFSTLLLSQAETLPHFCVAPLRTHRLCHYTESWLAGKDNQHCYL